MKWKEGVIALVAFAAGFAAARLWIEFRVEPLETNTEATIGFIGCSNTAQSVIGYHLVGNDLWEIPAGRERDFDGGAVADWVNIGNSFWHTFDDYLAANPRTHTVWWQMCIRRDEEPTLEDAKEIISGIKDRIPDVIIYVSALPSYESSECEITGTAGLVRGQELARQLAAQGDTELGPELRQHTSSEILDDGCHLNEEGMRSVGEQLKEFFNTPVLDKS